MEKKLKKKKKSLITFIFSSFFIVNFSLYSLQPNKFTAFTSFDPEKD
jgi:hypothetical protein